MVEKCTKKMFLAGKCVGKSSAKVYRRVAIRSVLIMILGTIASLFICLSIEGYLSSLFPGSLDNIRFMLIFGLVLAIVVIIVAMRGEEVEI